MTGKQFLKFVIIGGAAVAVSKVASGLVPVESNIAKLAVTAAGAGVGAMVANRLTRGK